MRNIVVLTLILLVLPICVSAEDQTPLVMGVHGMEDDYSTMVGTMQEISGRFYVAEYVDVGHNKEAGITTALGWRVADQKNYSLSLLLGPSAVRKDGKTDLYSVTGFLGYWKFDDDIGFGAGANYLYDGDADPELELGAFIMFGVGD